MCLTVCKHQVTNKYELQERWPHNIVLLAIVITIIFSLRLLCKKIKTSDKKYLQVRSKSRWGKTTNN